MPGRPGIPELLHMVCLGPYLGVGLEGGLDNGHLVAVALLGGLLSRRLFCQAHKRHLAMPRTQVSASTNALSGDSPRGEDAIRGDLEDKCKGETITIQRSHLAFGNFMH